MDRIASRWSLAAFLWAVSTPAQAADCPPIETFARSFVLHNADGRTDLRVRRLTPTDLVVETVVDGKLTNTMIYRDGLFLLSAVNAQGVTTYEYDSDIGGFPLRVGSNIRFSALIRTPGKADIAMTSQMRVVATESINVGACAFPAVRIERTNRFASDAAQRDDVIGYFSPDLLVPLQTTIHFADGRRRDFVLKGIEAR